jgi:hypothetical protein
MIEGPHREIAAEFESAAWNPALAGGVAVVQGLGRQGIWGMS